MPDIVDTSGCYSTDNSQVTTLSLHIQWRVTHDCAIILDSYAREVLFTFYINPTSLRMQWMTVHLLLIHVHSNCVCFITHIGPCLDCLFSYLTLERTQFIHVHVYVCICMHAYNTVQLSVWNVFAYRAFLSALVIVCGGDVGWRN